MSTNPTPRSLQFEQFESRLCLAVTVGVGSNGDLNITGDSAGPIEIVAIDSDSYQVSENGSVVATADGVRRAIRITLGAASDDVTLDLAGQSVNKDVLVDLGSGDNSFTLTDGTIRGHLVINGAEGADTVDVQSNINVSKNTTLELGAGDNVATVSGRLAGQLTIETDVGNDTVTISDGSSVAKHAKVRLGAGTNIFSMEGDVARHLFYDGFEGDD